MSSLSIDSNSLTLNPYSLGATQSIGGIQSLQDSTDTTQGATSATDTNSTGPAASTHISKQGKLLSKLQQLQKQDPAKFKQVVTDIAGKLQAAAANATGDDKTNLTNLAAKFQAAETGDLSGFQPPAQAANSAAALYQQSAQAAGQTTTTPATAGSHTGHHHHHGSGQASAGQQTLSSIFSELNSALGTSTTSDSSASAIPSSQAAA